MKKIVLLLVLVMNSTVHVSYADAVENWKLVKNADGIQIYTMPLEGSDVDAFRGVVVVDASLTSVLAVINDVPSQPRWMASCAEARVLRRINGNRAIVYRVTKAPWPVSDRDMVIISTVTVAPGGRTAVVTFAITEDHKVPLRPGTVRMKEMEGKWILERLADDKTRVILQVRSNPGGSIPSSVANMASRSIPFKTLQGLRRTVKEPKYMNSFYRSAPPTPRLPATGSGFVCILNDPMRGIIA